jgi:uncharacterized LabA/DUF88 family protein
MTIPRTVQSSDRELKMDQQPTSHIGHRITTQTWQERRDKILSPDGYYTGKQLLKATPAETWRQIVNDTHIGPAIWYIYSIYFFYATRQLPRSVDLTKFKSSDMVQMPVRYFLLDRRSPNVKKQDSGGALRFLQLLNQERFDICVKFSDEVEDLLEETTNKSDSIAATIGPEMLARMVQDCYTEKFKHAIIVSSDSTTLPPGIQIMRQNNIKVTLALDVNTPVSNYYISQFDYVVELASLLEVCNVLYDTPASETRKTRL